MRSKSLDNEQCAIECFAFFLILDSFFLILTRIVLHIEINFVYLHTINGGGPIAPSFSISIFQTG